MYNFLNANCNYPILSHSKKQILSDTKSDITIEIKLNPFWYII